MRLVAQSCLTLCHPMDCSPPRSSVHGDSPSKNTGVGCRVLLQGIFPTQGSDPGLLHYRWIHYCLSNQGSRGVLEGGGSLSLLQGIFPIQESNWGLLHCRQILYQLRYQGSPIEHLPSARPCCMHFILLYNLDLAAQTVLSPLP